MSASCAQRCRIYNKINVNRNINEQRRHDNNDINMMLGTISNVPMELGPANFRTKLYIDTRNIHSNSNTNTNTDFIIGRDLLRYIIN